MPNTEGPTITAGYYIIRGGSAGRERLRLLSRVMHGATTRLLDRVGVRPGMSYLDMGCGGGDVTIELAKRAGPTSQIVGEDIDTIKLSLAEQESKAQGFPDIVFRCADVYGTPNEAVAAVPPAFDFIYVRFLLTHLPNPRTALSRLVKRLRPGGMLVVEDIDFSGHLCHPEHPAFRSYHELHIESMHRRGGDPYIGPKLPGMLKEAGLCQIEVNVEQPIGITGEVKLVPAITMENIGEAILSDGLCTKEELATVIGQLHQLAQDETTLTGMPRIIQTWARRGPKLGRTEPGTSQ